MGKHTIFVVLGLTVVWIILMEELSIQAALLGVITSVIVTLFTRKFLPYQEIGNVSFLRLITYPFFLIGQIYIAGFSVIKIIIKGPVVDIVTIKTKLKTEALQFLLADSITLTPGSILLDIEGNDLTLLWIRSRETKSDSETAGELLKGKLERRLIKAEKDA